MRSGNVCKFHVDGKGAFTKPEPLSDYIDYFWALSQLIEEAQESIMILDWWLTPELAVRALSCIVPKLTKEDAETFGKVSRMAIGQALTAQG